MDAQYNIEKEDLEIVLNDAHTEATRLHALIWAGNQLLDEKRDMRISRVEHASRVATLFLIAESHIHGLVRYLDKGFCQHTLSECADLADQKDIEAANRER